jgi:putative membrane protein
MLKRRMGFLGMSMALLFSASDAFSQPRAYPGGHMMGWGYGWGWGGAIMMVVFWVAIIVALVALIRWLWTSGHGKGAAAGQSPLDILKARYAKGEINKEEFEQKKKDLGS